MIHAIWETPDKREVGSSSLPRPIFRPKSHGGRLDLADRVTLESVKHWVEDFGLTHEPHPMDDDPAYDWALLVRGQAFSTLDRV